MIKELKMYTVICDNCGVDCNDGAEYSGYGDIGFTEDCAEDDDWKMVDMPKGEPNKHYCPDCWSYGDDDEIIINSSRTKPLNHEQQ